MQNRIRGGRMPCKTELGTERVNPEFSPTENERFSARIESDLYQTEPEGVFQIELEPQPELYF